jgi:transcriptional regulator with GAF, ATPase, and Fis domain
MADAKEIRAGLMERYLGLAPGLEDQALSLIVETGVRAVGGDEGSLLVYNPEANDLTFVMTYGNKEAERMLIGTNVPMGSLAGLAAETGQVQIGAPRYKDAKLAEAAGSVQSVISAPMMIGDRLIGVITAISNKPEKRFTESDGQLYACLATVAALVVNQALLLKSQSEGAEAAVASPAALAPDSAAQEVLDRVGRLLMRDSATVRQLARMLEAVEAMAPGGGAQ